MAISAAAISRGRCRQRHSLRRRLQLPPGPRLVEDSLEPNPAHAFQSVCRPTSAHESFLTADNLASAAQRFGAFCLPAELRLPRGRLWLLDLANDSLATK